MPRHKKQFTTLQAPAAPEHVVAPAPKIQRISYAGIDEASAASGISVDELAKAIKAGRLPAETSQRPFLILRADLEAYARDRNPSQKAAPGPTAFPNLPHPDIFKRKGPYSEPHASAPQLASLGAFLTILFAICLLTIRAF